MTITHKYLRNLFDNLSEENFDDFLMELQFSTLIIPTNDEGVPVLKFNDELYMPLFTDINEFNKFNNGDFQVADHDFNFYLELLIEKKVPNFIINPDAEKVPIKAEFTEFLEPNYIFDQDYQPFTTNEIRSIKDSINNNELKEFLRDESNRWNLEELVNILNSSDILTLLMSDENHYDKAEDGVLSFADTGIIPKCLYGSGRENYVLLFSDNPTHKPLEDDSVYEYTQLVNFPLLVRDVLNHDLDGFILNVNEENIRIPREHLRNFMKGFRCPNIDDYSMYAFTI